MGIIRWFSLKTKGLIRWVKLKLGLIDEPPLREFVYLDENAVISLLASTTGGITEWQTTFQRSQISSSITGSLSPTGGTQGAKASGKISASQEKASEIVRRYVIQSNFTELYDLRKDHLILSDRQDANEGITTEFPIQSDNSPISIEGLDVQTEELKRGNLLELDVELGSHDVYKIYKAFDLFYDIFESLPNWSEIASNIESEDFSADDFKSLIDIIDKFLTGLVPIVGRLQNYGIVQDGNKAYIVEKSLLEDEGIAYDTVSVVGFVKEDELWQDSTRFLFDESEYTVYCRIDDVQISDQWVPLKLLDVIDDATGGTSESVQNLPEVFNMNSDSDSPETSIDLNHEIIKEDVKRYIDRIAEDISETDKQDIANRLVQKTDARTLNIDIRERTLKEVGQILEEDYGAELDVIDQTDIYGDVLFRDAETRSQLYRDSETDWFLEVSFISIYW